MTEHGEARAIDGNALTGGEIVVAASDAKLTSGSRRGDALDDPDVVDETGEHYGAPNAKIVIKSSSKGVRSTIRSRASEAAVDSDTWANALSAPVPSTTGA